MKIEKYKELKRPRAEEEKGVNSSFKAVSEHCNTKQTETIMVSYGRWYQAENMILGSGKKHKANWCKGSGEIMAS